jgi:hypothetical protein
VFDITPEHLTPKEMEPLKFSYDSLADDCLDILDTLSPPAPRPATEESAQQSSTTDGREKPPKATAPGARRDLFELLKTHHGSHPTLSQLWKETNTVPDWVDWDQIKRGQDVFYRYGSACLTGLAFQSLLGGMGASRVVETLARTGAFGTKVARRRLYETTQHILQVTMALDMIQPGGEGWTSTVRVRLLHASVRRRIMALEKESPSYYNTAAWGVPINDLDSTATIVTFSSTLIWQSLPRQGIFLRKREVEDYIALWRYVAHVIGCPTDCFASPAVAKRTLESLILYEINPSPLSGVLANNIISALSYTPPIYATPNMLIASARWMNGHDLCDALDLPRPSAYYYLLMVGQCLFFMIMTYGYRHIEYLDRRKQEWMRRAFWIMIVKAKDGLDGKKAQFEFKWIPKSGKGTIQEGPERKTDGKESPGIEWRNLKVVLYAIVVFVLSLVASFKLLGFAARMAFL